MADYQYNPNVEQWKDIPGHPGYQVSDHGRIKSFRQKITRIMTPHGSKHQSIILQKNGKIFKKLVHRLVLESFAGDCPDGCEACHNDGNPLNNHLINLRWDTHKNNLNDMIIHGTRYRGEQLSFAKLTNIEITKIRELYLNGIAPYIIAPLFGVSMRNIYYIVKNKTWTHV